MRFLQNNNFIIKVKYSHENKSLQGATGRVIAFSAVGSEQVDSTRKNKCAFLTLIKNSNNLAVDISKYWFLIDFELENNKEQLKKLSCVLHDGNLGDHKNTRFFIPYESLIFNSATLQQKQKSIRIKRKCVS